MAADVMVDPNQTSALIVKDGQNVTTLQPKNYPMPTRVVDFLCPSLDACGRWAAGSYQFQVTVNGGPPRSTMGTTYNFVPRQTLRILARPVKAIFSGNVVSVPNDNWKMNWTVTRATYPIAEDAITWDARDELDVTNLPNLPIDVDTETGRRNLWQALKDLQPPECTMNPKGTGCYDLIVGFIGQNPRSETGGRLAGYTYTGPRDLSSTVVTVATDADANATVAHEIAHTRQLGDTYANGSINCTLNPSPDGVMGSDFNTQQPTVCTAGRMKANNIDQPGNNIDGTLVPARVNAYDVSGPGPLPDKGDFMAAGNGSASTSFWITPDSYTRLFTQLAPAAPQAAQALATIATIPVVRFSGFVTAAGVVTLQPWQSSVSQALIPANSGAYSVRAVDPNGVTLASQGFNVSFFVLSNPPTTVTSAHFGGIIAFPANTAKFQILKGATLLKELLVSISAPVVTQVTPVQPGQTISGKITIFWSAIDGDGKPLTYNVEYNPNVTDPNPVWELIGDNLTATSYTYDFSGLPGGQHAVIRVTATDGVRSGSALSTQFAVPFKAPEVVIDNEPNSNFELTDEVELSGAAVDLQDGIVADAGLVWSSNISGKLGVGGDLVVNLPAGAHTITLTATDSA
ncbi:MAG: fibronectin type III domain-containing protein, partial [Acidobacteriota bacterium]|nr:fibronectin type III domain-containing protein [Acidobacteriota bacterium]